MKKEITLKKEAIIVAIVVIALIGTTVFCCLDTSDSDSAWVVLSINDHGVWIDSQYTCNLIGENGGFVQIRTGWYEYPRDWVRPDNYTIQTNTYFQPGGYLLLDKSTGLIRLKYSGGYYDNSNGTHQIYKTVQINGTITDKWSSDSVSASADSSSSSSSSILSGSSSSSSSSSAEISETYRFEIDNKTQIEVRGTEYHAYELGENFTYWPYEVIYIKEGETE